MNTNNAKKQNYLIGNNLSEQNEADKICINVPSMKSKQFKALKTMEIDETIYQLQI